jgi:biopolymer transport protein TolQ
LFATALGLFAAIPAVIAYNRFSYGINRIEARLQRFADGFHGTLSRELEMEG